jgi:hypothetical protein
MDNFFVELPKTAGYDSRCLLVAAAIMMDFTWFEEGGGKNNQRGHHF